jgi:16S rRNA (adenine1518-N6/adenine1519-N6)-dimethyltransferase
MAKKSLGQNFLMHRSICERIVIASKITNKDTVLEIGPGKGILTRVLLLKAKKVIAVETDDALYEQLKDTFAKEIAEKRLLVIHDDIRIWKKKELVGKYHIVANIPYYITGEIIRNFLESDKKPVSMTLLVQKEVAERVARTQKESLLSLSIKLYGLPTYCFSVSKGAFLPPPKVDSAVLSIQGIHKPSLSGKTEKWFFEVLHAGFGQKRKRLAKNLEKVSSKSSIQKAFEKAKLGEHVRAEELNIDEWKTLVKNL